MKKNKDLEKVWRQLCADLSNDDGLTPEDHKKLGEPAGSQASRVDDPNRAKRLCAQANKAIHLSLIADCKDEDLQSLIVARVEPAPDVRHLRVTLVVPPHCELDMASIVQKIHAVSHLLRHAVARSIRRKRAPKLSFVVEAQSQRGPEADDE